MVLPDLCKFIDKEKGTKHVFYEKSCFVFERKNKHDSVWRCSLRRSGLGSDKVGGGGCKCYVKIHFRTQAVTKVNEHSAYCKNRMPEYGMYSNRFF